ncbi:MULTISPECIES: PapB/FocB family fimbrial expression transcriptional regulator [Shewanella]|uniref:PapB/FocB family fimbrial expression transcriptional regulator n=1 Tax=Shewanella TaxID=22 RepID=UPI000F421A69|nr:MULTISPECIES: PapB/FocB family fimbrial expression transcriptional regulator [Shewanella]AYV12337.1 hypothetical protein EEY24_05235 [Shewanella algae]NJI82875.1 hypothetical protein [Shewanella sp. Iso12]
MKHLIPGMESQERFELLISFTDITSEPMISALQDHYVKGHPASVAAKINGIDPGNLSTNQKSMEQVAARIERVKEIDWQRFGYKATNSCGLTNKGAAR